jgi:hypothetical protein
MEKESLMVSAAILFMLMNQARSELSRVHSYMEFDDYHLYADDYEYLESEIMGQLNSFRKRARLLKDRMSRAVAKDREPPKQQTTAKGQN